MLVEIVKAKKMNAQELLTDVFNEFGDKVAIASSFGAEDMVLIDMASRLTPKPKVFTLDTGRLPQETYDLIERVRKKYNLQVDVYFPDREQVEEMVRKYGPNLFYRSVELRKLCCQVRKVEPLKRALSNLSAWVCGLRKEQSVTRSGVEKVEIDEANGGIVKLNPLADWSTEDVWDYIKRNKVPYNALHDRGYPSIGCLPCTRAVKLGEDIRAGRWWWEKPGQKECGLHERGNYD
jgi:phosphoadenosine phosphosulfate reductase